jgi:predicted DNA-binding transcriptional regulator AlpA
MATSTENAYRLRQASEYIGVSQAAMRTWKRSGTGPPFFRAGKLLRFCKCDLDAWISATSQYEDSKVKATKRAADIHVTSTLHPNDLFTQSMLYLQFDL